MGEGRLHSEPRLGYEMRTRPGSPRNKTGSSCFKERNNDFICCLGGLESVTILQKGSSEIWGGNRKDSIREM